MTEALKECPLCQDPMRISGQYFRHVADADGECLLSRHAWPLEDLPRWNTRANDCAELVKALAVYASPENWETATSWHAQGMAEENKLGTLGWQWCRAGPDDTAPWDYASTALRNHKEPAQ